MASTAVLAGLDLTKWSPKFLTEYIRKSGFEPYMGTSEDDIIHVKMDLQTSGFTIRIPLVGRLQGQGVSGNAPLSGNEEQLDQYYQDIAWDFYRHAMTVSKYDQEKSAVDLVGQFRPSLRNWAAEKHKYQIIDCLHTTSGGLLFSASDATARNLWMNNNADRVLFGATVANAVSGVHATALALVDNTDDKLTTTLASQARLMARTANPHIRPYKTEDGREFYVMFCHPLAFRDLKRDTAMTAANRDARPRDVSNNPLFQDGDLIYDGIIFREIPEFYQPRVGATSTAPNPETTFNNTTPIQCGANFLCGAQALGKVMKQAPMPTVKSEDDYGFIKGVGIEMAHNYSKLRWNNAGTPNNAGTVKDVGIVTVYTAAVA
ncbi:N4-gp56 family major capsid protein [Hyphomicrobium sp. 1Nfss2.1]|uniref:phage capsid family protein n=1 Tax=Hyphomicrobium sp. 1Nfss2.1 TaxID=3413936 RepID=UPI003C7C7593